MVNFTGKTKETMTEDELSRHAMSIFESSKNFREETGADKEWKDENDQYNSVFSKEELERSNVLLGQGRLFIPKTYSHAQRIQVDALETFFFDPEEVVSVTAWKSIPSETREIVKSLLNYRLNSNPINFYAEALEAIQDAIRNKVGIFKVFPNFKKKKSKRKIMGVTIGETEEEYFCPNIDCVPYEDVFFSPVATWKDYYKYPYVHRMVKSRDYLKRQGYKNLDLVMDAQIDDEIKEQRFKSQSPFSAQFNSKDKTRGVYIYEFWDFLDVNGDGYLESCSYIMAGDSTTPKIVIRGIEENTLPYQREGDDYNRGPIVLGQAFPESHSLMGKSLPGITKGLQKETNAIRNQTREAAALALRKPVLVNRGSGIDMMSLVNRRIGAIVTGDDISESSVREMQVSPVSNSSYAEGQITAQDFYETTSIPPGLLGVAASGEETATAVTAHNANANKKIQMVIKALANTLFIPSFSMLLRLEQEYESDEFIKKVTGRMLGWGWADDGVPAKDYIKGEFDLTVNMGINKQMQLNRYMLLMDRATASNAAMGALVQNGVIPPAAVSFIDPSKFYDKMLPILGEKNIQEFKIPAMPPPPQAGGPGVGVASQAVQPEAVGGVYPEVSNMNPDGGALLG